MKTHLQAHCPKRRSFVATLLSLLSPLMVLASVQGCDRSTSSDNNPEYPEFTEEFLEAHGAGSYEKERHHQELRR